MAALNPERRRAWARAAGAAGDGLVAMEVDRDREIERDRWVEGREGIDRQIRD